MRILDRHLLRSVLIGTLYGVAVLSVVLILGNLLKEALDLLINREVPLGYVLFFMACVLPVSLTFTVPWAFLTALLLVFGRMSADNETVAARACGISLARLCAPVVALAAVLCGLMLWVNASVAPQAELAMRASLADMARSKPAALFTPNEVIDQLRTKRIFVGHREEKELRNITIFDQNEEAEPRAVIHARKGSLESGAVSGQLILRLQGVVMESRPEGRELDVAAIQHGITAGEVVVPVALDEMVDSRWLWRPLRTFPLRELFAFLGQDLEQMEWPRRSAVWAEISKRFSLSLASLAFAFLAIPLGIVAHRRETSSGFGISVVVAFGYFFFIALSDLLRDRPAAHAYLLVWTPNLLFIGLGIWLFRRLDRH
jgi:lipopolysaccharide export system permease protein